MSYHYTDESRRDDPHALPDVEVFLRTECKQCDDAEAHESASEDYCEAGWYYAYGFSGCLWDSDPVGPYDTEEEALTAARETAGYCGHGVSDEGICEECPAPELWVLRSSTALSELYLIHTTTPEAINASAWASKDAASEESVRTGTNVHGFYPVRLSDDDARRWGKE